ncbi:MAG: hypothetical protein JNM17_10430 [Archangium sp.]|nr:hypothetical protein [Archangium sp.]
MERCGFVLENGKQFVFMFEDAPRSELKALVTFCESKKLVTRKWVDLGDRSEWQPR